MSAEIVINILARITAMDWLLALLFGVGLGACLVGLFHRNPETSRLLLVTSTVCLALPCLYAATLFKNVQSPSGLGAALGDLMIASILLVVAVMMWAIPPRDLVRVPPPPSLPRP